MRPKAFLRAVVVDDGFVDDVGAALGQGFACFADEHAFLLSRSQSWRMWPITMTSACGERSVEEAAWRETQALGEAEAFDVLLEDRPDFRQIEADAGEVGMGESDLGGGVALRGADVARRFCSSAQGNLAAMAMCSAAADAGHGGEELLQAGRDRRRGLRTSECRRCGLRSAACRCGEPR